MRTAIVFGLLVAATPALGAYFDGNALNDLCRSDKRSAAYYVIGSTEQMQGFCVPENVTFGQVTDVVCNHLQEHPENRQLMAGFLTHTAVAQAWPCQ